MSLSNGWQRSNVRVLTDLTNRLLMRVLGRSSFDIVFVCHYCWLARFGKKQYDLADASELTQVLEGEGAFMFSAAMIKKLDG